MVIDWVHIAELLFSAIAAVSGAYAAIRSRLAVLDSRVERTEREVARAHDRIDNLLTHH